MQIQLKQQHVEAAIRAYVAKAGIQFPIDKIDFTAGRGKDGLTASIEMEDPFLGDVAEPSQDAEPASKPETKKAKTPMSKRGVVNEQPEPELEEQPTAEEVDPQAGYAALEEEAAKEEVPAEEAPPFSPEEEVEKAERVEKPEPAKKNSGKSLFG